MISILVVLILARRALFHQQNLPANAFEQFKNASMVNISINFKPSFTTTGETDYIPFVIVKHDTNAAVRIVVDSRF